MIYTAMTLDGKKVTGSLLESSESKHIVTGFLHEMIKGKIEKVASFKIIPTTLRVLINGKEYTVEEVEAKLKEREDCENCGNFRPDFDYVSGICLVSKEQKRGRETCKNFKR